MMAATLGMKVAPKTQVPGPSNKSWFCPTQIHTETHTQTRGSTIRIVVVAAQVADVDSYYEI